MRPLRNVDEVGADNLMEKRRLVPVEALWNEWEIHCLILVSFGLQVFLFFTAGLRRRSTSRVLRTVLWLAYLSADSVAIFVLGHLAVHASGPRHQLLLFWAPFVLVHLGGQDTITAFSMQDNELWKRHLLGLVSQVAVAAYVVSRSSWPDRRLLAAMVLMFLCGCFKYAERTFCLYFASPANIREDSMGRFGWMIHSVAQGWSGTAAVRVLKERFDAMLSADGRRPSMLRDNYDMLSHAPLNDPYTVLAADDLPGLLGELRSSKDRCRAYDYVGARLVLFYEALYTKAPLRVSFIVLQEFGTRPVLRSPGSWHGGLPHYLLFFLFLFLSLFLFLFTFVCTSTALVLFTVAQKGGQPYGRADVNVSYVLLIGATILEVASLFMSILSFSPVTDRIQSAISRVATYIQPAGRTRQHWSERLAQYSMIKRYTGQGVSFVPKRVVKRLNAWGVELFDPSLTHTPTTEDLKKFVLDKLLDFGTGEQQDWNFASTRGELALRRWMADPARTCTDSERPFTDLHKSIHGVDFPTSVLIWHIATDICYYFRDDASIESDQMKRSRELSNYIMYLVFKCGVMLTSNSQHVHRKTHGEMKRFFAGKQSQHDNLGEKEAVMMVLEAKNDERQANTDNSTSSNTHLQHLRRTMIALDSPVLPRAREVAQELIGINTEADRWGLIAEVWLEMLYYIAPRCGVAFHYQHLSTGGEFITHVALLMYYLGPFLPSPGA